MYMHVVYIYRHIEFGADYPGNTIYLLKASQVLWFG